MVTSGLVLKTVPCILATIAVARASLSVRGVAPDKQHLYTPRHDDTWQCLDGSKTIQFSSVNDDYCDCRDGSDEPGTPACSNGYFYCENKGHIPAYIKSWAVNDGICDEACCDGSDEATGRLIQCPDRCKEMAEIYQHEQAELHKLTSAGLAAKKKLTDDALELVDEWLDQKAKYEEELVFKRAELSTHKRELDLLEGTTLADQNGRKASARRASSSQYEKLKTVTRHVQHLEEEIEVLLSILHDLKRDHNHNFQDVAVKTALAGYDEFLIGYEDLKEEIKHDAEEQGDIDEREDNVEVEDVGEDALTENKIESPGKIVTLFKKYRENLGSAIPPVLKDKLNKLFPKNSGDTGYASELDAVRAAHNALDSEIQSMERKLNVINSDLEKDYGPQRIWLKLKDVCVEKNDGEYTYSLCVLGAVHQKSNKDNTRTYLGQFEDYVGTGDQRYQVHRHTHGTQCWNGPERSARAVFECGAETEVLEVTEPEKCEYHFKMRSPAVCSDKKLEQQPQLPTRKGDILHEEL